VDFGMTFAFTLIVVIVLAFLLTVVFLIRVVS
jgi:hypothetical protein